jgi:hypothetical protein
MRKRTAWLIESDRLAGVEIAWTVTEWLLTAACRVVDPVRWSGDARSLGGLPGAEVA